MGIGARWKVPTTRWDEKNYTNLCVNACWELYGANDPAHLPSSGAKYVLKVEQGKPAAFPWVTKWDEDEGKGTACAASSIQESHNDTTQLIDWDIS